MEMSLPPAPERVKVTRMAYDDPMPSALRPLIGLFIPLILLGGTSAQAYNLRDFDPVLKAGSSSSAVSSSRASSRRTTPRTRSTAPRSRSSSSRQSSVTPTVRPLTRAEIRRAARLVRLEQQTTSSGSLRTLARMKTLVIRYSNAERSQAGAGPLSADAVLELTAQKHAEDMRDRNFFSHVSPSGGTLESRLREQKYFDATCNCRLLAAENIAKGYRDAAEVVQAWMDSPGHRKNLLHPQYSRIGIGIADTYWVQVFGGSVTVEASPPTE